MRNLKTNHCPRPEPMEIISLGAGVQSSAMLLMADAGEILPRPAAAIFADTQAEPPSVYEWLEYLEKVVRNIPIIRVSAGSLRDSALTIYRSKKGGNYTRRLIPFFTKTNDGRIGRANTRGCTVEFKITPFQKKVREIAKIKYGQNFSSANIWLGISTDEASRMRDSNKSWCTNRYPLIEMRMNRDDCIAYVQENFSRIPPRSSCYFCPFHSSEEWKRLKILEPKTFNDAITFERDLQTTLKSIPHHEGIPFLTKSCTPLGDAVDIGRDQANLFNEECLGYCGN